MEHIVVMVTTSQTEEPKKIADKLVREKIAACVNIIPAIDSMFWWEDKIHIEPESLLIVKTTKHRLEKLIKVVKEHHSYTVPEIIALPIIGGNEDYLKWIDEAIEDRG